MNKWTDHIAVTGNEPSIEEWESEATSPAASLPVGPGVPAELELDALAGFARSQFPDLAGELGDFELVFHLLVRAVDVYAAGWLAVVTGSSSGSAIGGDAQRDQLVAMTLEAIGENLEA